ncbi:phytoene desaturase family protein [Pyxidicoccus xibeiensis]|uniref:phytoene desaturase family protein n=1 Tax=Pyxidicoccus xibeiensis TaxID=2906759 RepID=UPI0020A760C7|nr:FAD-dependent oxidoreductase [Pyxidicoccus xibeiensis]MCP3136819.1 FAD-dependent oxidoreductase [Pyxidicoccus xibeiensis]
MQATRIAVVGGGVGGLAAAALLAREGHTVTLYERAKHFGGRAQTSEVEGFRFNLGPHALYLGGAAARVLGRLGVKPQGGLPGAGSFALEAGRLHTLPRGPVSLMTTDLLGLAGKLEFARLLAGVGRIDTRTLSGMSMREWMNTRLSRDDARALVGAVTRVSSYCADHDALSADAALSQIQLALASGVRYLDGGWSTLVDALASAARDAGARLETSAKVEALVRQGPGAGAPVRGVRLADGTVHDVDAVVVAGGPADVAALVPGDAVLAKEAVESVSVRAATLELGLSRLPKPEALFALGIDGPWYVSVHSAAASGLAPEGGAMVHVMKYLTGADDTASEADLEAVMDVLQPGWRMHVVARRFRPDLRVSHRLPTVATGGLAGRPPAQVPHVSGLYRVGDWVGPEGMLADASFASAESVAASLTRSQREQPRRAAGA